MKRKFPKGVLVKKKNPKTYRKFKEEHLYQRAISKNCVWA